MRGWVGGGTHLESASASLTSHAMAAERKRPVGLAPVPAPSSPALPCACQFTALRLPGTNGVSAVFFVFFSLSAPTPHDINTDVAAAVSSHLLLRNDL